MTGRAAGLALGVLLFSVLPHGMLCATLNFTLVDTNNGLRLVQEEILGFHMAVADAQNHVDGLFPEHSVRLVDRTVVDPSPNNLKLSREVVAGVDEDNPVAFFGGLQTGASFLIHNILDPEGMPQASMSLVKHLPITTAQRNFGATTDVLVRCKALARLMLDNGLNAVTLVHAPTDTFTILGLFFEQELPALGVRVEQRLRVESGQGGSVADAIQESSNRVVLVFGLPSDLQEVLLAAEERNMTQSDFVWLYSHDAVLQPVVTTRHNAFPDLTRLVADTKLLTFALADVNASSPDVQSFLERAIALPPVASVGGYSVASDGLTSVFAAAYDTGMAMLRAVNRTLASNASAWDRAAVVQEMKQTNYQGISGHLQYGDGYGGLLHTSLFKQYSHPITDAGATVATAMEYNTLTDTVSLSAPSWNTATNLPPSPFAPESCGVLLLRTAEGFCVPCGAGMRNDPTDGVEACAFCGDGHELQGGECVACGENEEGSRLASGEPVCDPKAEADTDWGVAGGIAAACVVGTACLAVAVVAVHRKVSRARAEVAEHRAKAKQARFLAFSFHELRNPLNVVSSALEFATDTIKDLASEGDKDVDGVLRDLQCGQQSVVDTVHVLDTINMLSQVIHGVVATVPQPTCVKELAREVVAVAREVRASMLAHEPSENALSRLGGGGEGGEGGGGEGGGEEGEGGEEEGGDKNDNNGASDVELATVVTIDGVNMESRKFFVALDKQKMRQVLLILLINALKYTPKGRIVVEIDIKRRTRGSFYFEGAAHRLRPDQPDEHTDPVAVHMCVRDTGSGMPPEDLEHVFDLDHQTERGSVRSTGLGLVLAHRFVAMHGGELKVRSVHAANAVKGQNTGTRFWWTISTQMMRSGAMVPKRQASKADSGISNAVVAVWGPGEGDEADVELGAVGESKPRSEPPLDSPRSLMLSPHTLIPRSTVQGLPAVGTTRANSNTTGSSAGQIAEMVRTMPTNLRVLLMEDVKLNRVFMRRKLSSYPFGGLGWVVEEVETGEQCLELIVDKGAQFDVVFCDQILSNAGGKLLGNEVAKRLREHEEQTNAEKRMVLIACSGNASDEDRKVYLESGMDGVVAKPLPEQKVLFAFLHPLLAHDM